VSEGRPPIPPPRLEGYEFLQLIGTGGFADVFLYERAFPRQKVAIKVLVGEAVGAGQRERFTSEANTMASLSTHPYIVSVYQADVSPEGHPYLVMEYYPRPNFAVRARNERFSAADVLRTGVQVASAVETAHRAGILHRDIKPANILTSEYSRPGLTDFGIAAVNDERAAEAEGLSVPWSPPEVILGSGVGDERSDVYSLAATLYTLLAGRTPFEIKGEESRTLDLIGRIQRSPVPPIDRPDVPGSLQRLLAQAMAKDPAARPASAAAFARELQAIEVEQRLGMTTFEVSDPDGDLVDAQPIDADAGSTRMKGPSVIEAQTSVPPPVAPSAPRGGETISRTFVRPASSTPRPMTVPPQQPLIAQTPYVATAKPPPSTVPTPSTATAPPQAASTYMAAQPRAVPMGRRRTGWLWGAGLIAVLVAAALAFVVLRKTDGPTQVDAKIKSVDVVADPSQPQLWRVVWTFDGTPNRTDQVQLAWEGKTEDHPATDSEARVTSEANTAPCVRATLSAKDGRQLGGTVASVQCPASG